MKLPHFLAPLHLFGCRDWTQRAFRSYWGLVGVRTLLKPRRHRQIAQKFAQLDVTASKQITSVLPLDHT